MSETLSVVAADATGPTICGAIPGTCGHFMCGYQLAAASRERWRQALVEIATYQAGDSERQQMIAREALR